MARITGKDARIYVDKYDLSGRLSQGTLDLAPRVHDVTCFSDGADYYIEGRAGWTLETSGFFDAASGEIDEVLQGLIGSGAERVGFFPRGDTSDYVGYEGDAVESTYEIPIEAEGVCVVNASFQGHDKPWRVKILHKATVTTAASGSSRDMGVPHFVLGEDNVLNNPGIEEWHAGTVDAQPDDWTDYESLAGGTGTNNREATEVCQGSYALKTVATTIGDTGYKGITATVPATKLTPGNNYTLIAWAKNAAITNGKIVIEAEGTNTGSQKALDSGAANTSYAKKSKQFTMHASDTTLTVRAYILATAASCSGTAYIDKMALVSPDGKGTLRVIDFSGTDFTVELEDSATGAFGGEETSLVTFTQATGTTEETKATTSPLRYIRAKWSGTFTSVAFIVTHGQCVI